MKWKMANNFEIERYVHRGLPFKRMREIKKQMKKDVRLREEIEKVKKSDRDFKNKFPADLIIPKIIDRYHEQTNGGESKILRSRKVSRKWFFAAPALAVVLLLAIIMRPPKEPVQSSVIQEDIILKGQQNIDFSKPQLIIHRKKNSDVEVLQNGARGRAGDLLQLAYVAAKQSYGVILSIDGNGKVTLHYPLEKNNPTSLTEEKYYLPEAIELDNAPQFERFFFITSNSNLNVETIMQVARKLADDPIKAKKEKLDLPEGFKQVSINIIKEI